MVRKLTLYRKELKEIWHIFHEYFGMDLQEAKRCAEKVVNASIKQDEQEGNIAQINTNMTTPFLLWVMAKMRQMNIKSKDLAAEIGTTEKGLNHVLAGNVWYSQKTEYEIVQGLARFMEGRNTHGRRTNWTALIEADNQLDKQGNAKNAA